MKTLLIAFLTSLVVLIQTTAVLAQPVITNKRISMGTTGRIGVGFSPSAEGNTGRALNLLGHGSLGGRLEQGDYIDLLPAFHFKTVNVKEDTTAVVFQARLGFYNGGGQFLGNVNSRSIEGMTISLPEAFVEVRNLMGSQWSMWAGARYQRFDDIHINDYFYFDDHSSEGFGISHKNTALTVIMPSAIDTSDSYPPYSFENIISGTSRMALRQRTVMIGEHKILMKGNASLKLLGEYHVMSATKQYKGDHGWVLGAKWNTPLKTAKPGFFNDLSVRYGHGIANGGDNGHTKTWVTYGAPDFETQTFKRAYSITAVEHLLLNLSDCFSINPYAVYTRSRGGASDNNKSPDYYGRTIFNRKTDFAVGMRSFVYLTDWLHLINEVHYTTRKDGNQATASMTKFTFAPTIVPTAERSPWARPHIRFIFEAAHYNKFARDNLYSPFLQYAGHKEWGTYFGVRSEWWIF